ncbi:MAG: hypothetical protein LBR46_01845 [Prevotella sp.]|jgi:hypothetical protein|nr:hypothetical protein [Prevotella sp.]
MDDTNKSTVEEPLKFFQWMFLENELFNFKHEILYSHQEEPDFVIDGDKVSYSDVVADNYDNPLDIIRTIDFKVELQKKLIKEYDIFIQSLDKAFDSITYQGNSPDLFLSRLHKKAVNILNATNSKIRLHTKEFEPIIKQYPFVEDILLNIIHHIEKEQQTIQSVQNTSHIKEVTLISEDIKNQVIYTKDNLIDDLFMFLKDEYISTTEWEYLMSYLKSFIIEYKVPHVERVFNVDKRKRPVIKYLFYKLYSSLLNSRNFADKFSEFYLKAFVTLTPTEHEIKNMSKKFATPPKLPKDFPMVNKIL